MADDISTPKKNGPEENGATAKGVKRLSFRFSTVVATILLVVLAGALFALFKAQAYAEVATGFVAKQMCTCLWVENRDEDQCKAELGDDAKPVKIVYFEEKVIANLYGLAQAEADLKPGFGCSVRDSQGVMPNAGPQ